MRFSRAHTLLWLLPICALEVVQLGSAAAIPDRYVRSYSTCACKIDVYAFALALLSCALSMKRPARRFGELRRHTTLAKTLQSLFMRDTICGS